MPNILDLLVFPLCIVATLGILFFRYWQSKHFSLTGRTDMNQVGASYWGVYAGTDMSSNATVKLPDYGHQHCTSCNGHPDHEHHLAK